MLGESCGDWTRPQCDAGRVALLPIELLDNPGTLCFHRAQFEAPLLEASEQLEPTDSIVHYRLATLYRKAGRMDDARREVELYKKYKDMKDKLRAVYKELQVQPDEIRADENPEEEPPGKK